MGTVGRRVNGFLSFAFPEKRLFIQSGHSTRYLRLTPLSQFLTTTAAVIALGWMAVATATVVIDRVAVGPDARAVVIKEAYQTRLEELADERDQRAAEARSAQGRFQVAMEQVSRQQTAILQSVEERRELSTALDLMRQRLGDAVGQRDTVAAANDRLLAQMKAVNDSLTTTASGADLTETLRHGVRRARRSGRRPRHRHRRPRARSSQQVADLELQVRVNGRAPGRDGRPARAGGRRCRSGPLEKVFKKPDLDVDSLIARSARRYSGQGGPARRDHGRSARGRSTIRRSTAASTS